MNEEQQQRASPEQKRSESVVSVRVLDAFDHQYILNKRNDRAAWLRAVLHAAIKLESTTEYDFLAAANTQTQQQENDK
jgi:hypothetical protein